MPIERLIPPRDRDLGGGFTVRRLLPSVAPRQGVGPFVFFDHFGPITTRPGDNHDVRPHPHIGLATVTYLFEGAMMHRDNLGSVQRIEPGAINWMTAGRGIVHSERTPPDLKQKETSPTACNFGSAARGPRGDLARVHAYACRLRSRVVRTGNPGARARGQCVRTALARCYVLRDAIPRCGCRTGRNVDLAAARERRYRAGNLQRR